LFRFFLDEQKEMKIKKEGVLLRHPPLFAASAEAGQALFIAGPLALICSQIKAFCR
jgi:hypothetical protein